MIGFAEYANQWIEQIHTQPNRSGKKRALGTVRSCKNNVDGYLIPEFGDTPVRAIDEARIRVMTDRLDAIPSPLNPKSKFNGVTRTVLVVLMMILRQVGVSGESVRRWLAQAEVDDGIRPGVTSEESAEVKRLKAENKRLRENNEILRRASIFFAGELGPRNR